MRISKNSQRSVIIAVTIGSILEWYEMFLYVYWAPVISKLFFATSSEFIALIDTLLIFAFGFLSRPLGGLFFGYLGDRFGRKISFIISVIGITIPSFIIGFLPSYASWGAASQILLGLARFLQGVPAGGELPGAICYLSECASSDRKKYMCSFSFVGAQIGGIIGIIECLLLEEYLSIEALHSWGWRLSFLLGGLLGLFGFYLRKKLHESPLFQRLENMNKISHRPIIDTFRKFKRKIIIGFFLSFSEVVGYFMIAVFPIVYFEKLFKIKDTTNLMITASFLVLSAVTIPFFGRIGDKYKSKPLLVISALGIILVTYPFYLAINYSSLVVALLLEMLLIFFLNFQFALIPALLSELFPTSVRFTALGFSFNVCDSIIGGLTPVFALYLIKLTGHPASFILTFAFASIVLLGTLFFIKEKAPHESFPH